MSNDPGITLRQKAERNARQANNLQAYLAERERSSSRSMVSDIEQEMEDYRMEIRSIMLQRAEVLHREAERLERTEKLIGMDRAL